MKPNNKIVKHGIKAREDAIAGVEVVYKAVSATLGPRSSNVGIVRPFGRPAVVHDGVTVAKEVLPLEDPFENFGAELAVESADKTNQVGDGTTTATVLMRNIAVKAHTAIASGAKPMALRAGIEDATKAIAEQLSNMATPIEKVEDVKRIATVSAQNEELGQMVADAYEQLGKEGIMSVEESKGTDTYLEIKTGMEIDRGYRSPYFVNDQILGEAQLEKAYVLVADYDIRSVEILGPILEKLLAEGVKTLMIVANEIDGEALAFMVVNHVKGNMKLLAVPAPGFGDKREDVLKDIATVTGATVITEKTGMGLTPETVTKALLGKAGRISATKDYTLIVEGGGPKEDIDARASEIKAKAEHQDTSDYDREKYMERYAKFKSGVAVLTIGAKSESEVKERKERAIDAISASKAGLAEGIVPGGGTALIEASRPKLFEEQLSSERSRDYLTGFSIVVEACQTPFNKLLDNAGYDPGRFIDSVGKGKGVDVTTGKVVDMIKAGIIDPVMVVRSALENASSNAVMVATTDVIIVEKTKEEKK